MLESEHTVNFSISFGVLPVTEGHTHIIVIVIPAKERKKERRKEKKKEKRKKGKKEKPYQCE